MIMNRMFVKVAITAMLLCPVAGVVVLLVTSGGATNFSGITPISVSTTPDMPEPNVSKPEVTTKSTPTPTGTVHLPTPANPLSHKATVHPPTPANPLHTPILHRPIPANPLKTPILYPPFSTVGPTAGVLACGPRMRMACVEVGK